jgi:elongation factor P
MVLRHEGDLYVVADYREAQSGKQKTTVHVKLRNLKTGHSIDRSLETLGRIEEVEVEHRQMQYLYDSGDGHVFMDDEDYEQYTLGAELIGAAAEYLLLEQHYRVLVVEGQPLTLELSDVVALAVTDTAPPTHGTSTGSNVTKEATLETGKVIRVPLFIKTGDRVRVDTTNAAYSGKES